LPISTFPFPISVFFSGKSEKRKWKFEIGQTRARRRGSYQFPILSFPISVFFKTGTLKLGKPARVGAVRYQFPLSLSPQRNQKKDAALKRRRYVTLPERSFGRQQTKAPSSG
jgi:hypothetical protein